MPVNFELDFIQPLLLDLQTGNFKSVDDYAKAITKYYQNTIAKGVPQGIPPTLPSPTAQGAPAPVSAGPGDAYAVNFSSPSHIRMEKVVVGYYKAKDAKISKETLDYYKGSLERLIQDYKKAKEVVENLVPLILKLKEDVKQLPQKLDELVQGVVIMYESYKEDLDKIISNGVEVNEGERLRLLETFKRSYNEEYELFTFIKEGDFSNIDQILATVKRFNDYLENQKRKGTDTSDIIKTRFFGLIRSMTGVFSQVATPEGFGKVLMKFKKDKSDLKSNKKAIIEKAEMAIESIKIIKQIVEPQIIKLQKRYELEKKNITLKFEKKIDEKKKLISDAIKERTEKFSKKVSEKVKGFKQKVEDVKAFKDEQYEKIKDEVQLVKDANSIIKDSVSLVVSVDEIYKKTKVEVLDIKTRVEELDIQPIKTVRTLLGMEGNLEMMKLIDGTTVLGAEMFEAGNEVFIVTEDEQKVPLPVGEYELENGMVLVVIEKGIISKGAADAEVEQPDNLKKLVVKERERLAKLKQDRDFREYSNTQNIDKEFIAILEPIVQKSATDFINIRNIIEKTDSSYTTLFIRLNSVEEDVDKLITKFNTLQTNARSYRNKRRADKGKEPIKTRAKSPKKPRFTKLKKSVLDVLKFIKRLKAKINRLIGRIQVWIKSQIKKKQEWMDRQATKIEIAILNSLPKSIVQESIETEEQAAEEKARLIKLYKKKIETLKKKGTALTAIAKSGAKLTTNAIKPDLSAASNEKPLRDFSENYFKFKTINVESNSPNYKRWFDWKKDFDKNIDKFKMVDTLLSVCIVLKKELEKPKGTLFIEKLVADFNKINNSELGLNKTNYGIVVNIITTFLTKDLGRDGDLRKLVQAINEIQKQTKGQTLKKFISSANITNVLIGVEREYLQKTRKHLQQLAAITTNANKLVSEIDKGKELTEKQTARRKKLSAFDAKIIQLDKVLNGRGSFIVELIDLIDRESKELEQWIKKKKKEIMKEVDEEFGKRKEKVEEWLKKKERSLKDKYIKNDLIPQTATYNIATNLFWAGASWVNSVGTTFTTAPIGVFVRLRVDGKLDGVESSVRELAKNLETQLSQLRGLVAPNPATGITPFTFVGYK